MFKIITAFFLALVFITLLSIPSFAQNAKTAFDQLVQVNEQWRFVTDGDPGYKIKTATLATGNELIKFHLQQTEKLLRNRNTSHLSPALRKRRDANLNALHAYWTNGVFPVNDLHTDRQPYFIDQYNTYCAVGYLMKQSGGDDVAREIKKTENFSYLFDIANPRIMKWAATSGLTLDELALIQPTYGNEWPSTVTELHYNNAGNDINEYIEIQQDYPYTSRKHLDSVLFYNDFGVLYKSMKASQFQKFFVDNRTFLYYLFPANDSLASRGRIELRGYIPYVPNIYLPIQTIVYSDTSTEVWDYDPYMSSNQSPKITKYNMGESESTSPNYSLNFCTGSLQVMSATPGTLNSCFSLPIKFLNFNWKPNNNKVDLVWQTASAANSSYFEIERSNNGIDFTSIGKVKSFGDNPNINSYSFTDNAPGYISHYRLKQVDFDGKYSYSKILFVKLPGGNPLLLAENLVKKTLQVQINAQHSNPGSLIIYDFSGRQLLTTKAKAGSQILDIGSLTAAKYLLRLYTIDGKVYNQQFVKE